MDVHEVRVQRCNGEAAENDNGPLLQQWGKSAEMGRKEDGGGSTRTKLRMLLTPAILWRGLKGFSGESGVQFRWAAVSNAGDRFLNANPFHPRAHFFPSAARSCRSLTP